MTRGGLLALTAVPLLAAALLLASALTDQPHRYFRDTVVVDAPRSAIWSVLTEFDRYHEWNPYVTSADGEAHTGARLKLRIVDGDELDAEVLIVRPQRKLEWETRLLAPGLLDHEQIFRVVPAGPDRFRIVQEARFEGLLAPLARVDDDRRGLVAMLRAAAARARDYQSSSE